MQKYVNELNDVQQAAVKNFNGPALVIAGAGSGKTRVLTYRIAHLLDSGVPAHSILALTFTNKAAREMKTRISGLVGEEKARNLWMGTFHSIFARILRMEADKLGYPSNFSIYDTIDSRSLIKSIIKELKLDDKTYKQNEVQSRISTAKNGLVLPQAYSNNPQIIEADAAGRKPEIGRIYKIYMQRCYKAGAMDFDDLLLNTNILLQDSAEAADKYRKKFKYILIDEYQDTNLAQYLIIKHLAKLHNNICVVGDDAQSIYSFRGARIENILNFRNDYPNYEVYKLEQNYRSTKNIVNAANSLIAKNKRQIQKVVWSDNETGEKIKVIKSITDNEEGYSISNMIFESRLREHYDYLDYAILYRTNAQSRIFEEALRKRNIPYKIYGGISFYQRKEIKDLIAYFRLIINHRDDESLKRIINYPARGIGKTTVDKLEAIAKKADTYLWHVIENSDKFVGLLNKGTVNKLKNFREIIISFSAGLQVSDAYDLAYNIASGTGIIKDLYNDKTPEGVSRYENLQELLNAIKDFTARENNPEDKMITLDRYIENVSLLTNEDNEKEEDRDKVTLMTIHSAKGLEFKNVYIVGVEQDLFPSSFSSASSEDLEEERRLFYVAITRAEKNAVLSYAMSRYRWGTPVDCTPSRFIRELDPELIEWDEGQHANHSETDRSYGSKDTVFRRRKQFSQKDRAKSVIPGKFSRSEKLAKRDNGGSSNKDQADFNASNPEEIQMGMKVEHQRFGIGKVIHLEGKMPNVKATVFFQGTGQKQLLLKFAKLRIVR